MEGLCELQKEEQYHWVSQQLKKGYIGLHEPVIQALDLPWLPCSRLESY